MDSSMDDFKLNSLRKSGVLAEDVIFEFRCQCERQPNIVELD